MTCESCVRSVSDSLYALEGINRVDADLEKQQVAVEGTGMHLASLLRIAWQY